MTSTHRQLPCGTVYTLISSPARLDSITAALTEVQPNLKLANSKASSAVECINAWNATKGVVATEVIPFSYECFITDCASETDGSIVYALYEQKIPVLHLVASTPPTTTFTHPLLETIIVSDGVSDNKNNNDGDHKTTTTTKDAIVEYFSFPQQRGRVIVIEGGDGRTCF